MREEQQAAGPVQDRNLRLRSPAGNDAGEQAIVSNLMEAITRLQNDLDRVELWTAALGCFLQPVPDYQPGDEHILPRSPRR